MVMRCYKMLFHQNISRNVMRQITYTPPPVFDKYQINLNRFIYVIDTILIWNLITI